MNDPLRDNRTFPEEMHEHRPVDVSQKSHVRLLFTFLLVMVAIFLGLFAYRAYENSSLAPWSKDQNEKTQEQVAFEKLQNSRPPLTGTAREEKINALFGN